MNRLMILYTLGKMLMIEGLLMLLPFLTGVIYQEQECWIYLIVAMMLLVLGHLMSLRKPHNKIIYAKEGFVVVAAAWIFLSVFGAIPFCMTGEIPSYIDALFEAVSGFTTTGSSILTDVESLSHASLFWRSFSHWIGGMGILVFVVAFLPDASGSTLHILKAEMPGPIVGKLVSKITVSSRILYQIYTVLTIIEVVLLMLGGMPFFDSLLNSFGTAGTGGFAIKNTSIAYYNSAYCDGIITFFMILFGINFNLIYFFAIKKFKAALKSEELRWYLIIIFAAAFAISFNILPLYNSIFEAFRYAIFQVGSIITTTGYVTADYGQWPLFSQTILVLLMFIGASAGSTGGGMKVSRIIIGVKSAMAEMKRMIHPHSVVSVKFEDKYLSSNTLSNIHVYWVLYFLLFGLSFLFVSLQNIDFISAFSAVATCFNNVGPGLGIVGPVGNFSSLTDLSKVVLSLDMLAGRLEIFPLLMFFSRSLWKK
ncbi:TrkH family potassium uptake protein [Allocoprobacillus halotolerans]|uniref:TrkH family potassium uptake protein n=1 Tax=Allocoprobacillus halotolerans TaxID=2944914 RepID=A0ABY5I0M3_9FIRM|nr:TrkH family potassium uptake protein [Allocoprobacillus halotolerans]UTY38906.1 TrkH family potassium uptake protein [Allocoprobacillus halotolerans]